MLGSHFDLKSEIARIAAKRAAETPAPEAQAHSDFDDKLSAFVRSLVGDAWSSDTIKADQTDDNEITPRSK